MPYETVTSYCFSKWWLNSKRQDWWPTSRGQLKQAFGVHPTEASDTGGLTHRKYEDLKRYVQGVNCVAVGEIGLDHVRVRQDKGCDQQTEVFPGFVDWRMMSVSLWSFTVEEQQARRTRVCGS